MLVLHRGGSPMEVGPGGWFGWSGLLVQQVICFHACPLMLGCPCFVFIDELDALVATRSGGGSESRVSERVISQFLTEMDF